MGVWVCVCVGGCFYKKEIWIVRDRDRVRVRDRVRERVRERVRDRVRERV